MATCAGRRCRRCLAGVERDDAGTAVAVDLVRHHCRGENQNPTRVDPFEPSAGFSTRTPWDSFNARLDGPAALQLTLFQGLGTSSPAGSKEGPA